MRLCSRVLCTVLLLFAAGAARQLAGVSIPEQLERSGARLLLNGAGVRSKYMMNLYVGGLYLTERSSDAAAIVDAEQPMAIRMHMVSSLVTAEKLVESTREGFRKSTGGRTGQIAERIDRFLAALNAQLSTGDVFDLVYIPGEGVTTLKNGSRVITIDGADFKRALFGIWLCNDPAQASLKRAMLGK